jgi:predicted small secreted protein
MSSTSHRLRVAVAAAALLAATLVSACNTVQGVGEDISAGARGVEKAVDK